MNTRYVRDEREMELTLSRLKLIDCPHCRQTGALNRHGSLRGYAEAGSDRIVRGRRVFCSNRARRSGCGRTFSILFAAVIAHFTVGTATLLRFVHQVLLGHPIRASWLVAAEMSVPSGYRLWRRFQQSQVRLRTFLHREKPPPDADTNRPLEQLLAHFDCVFDHSDRPLADFQARFQTGIFDR